MHIRDFYVHLLDIPEDDMQTVSWQDVVSKITTLRDQNVKTATNITPSQRRFISKQVGAQSKERLDAHDIANRLMRRENYIIALFNKDILNLNAPIPLLNNRQLFSKSLEWTVQFGVLDLIFNEGGQVHQRVLKSDHRGQLSKEMQTRFYFAAIMNLLFAPFLACGLLVNFIFTYYNVSYHDLGDTQSLTGSTGVQDQHVIYWGSPVHPAGEVEIPRVQRATASV